MKHMSNANVARHFAGFINLIDPRTVIHILEQIKLAKDIAMLSSIRDQRESVWIHRLNMVILKA